LGGYFCKDLFDFFEDICHDVRSTLLPAIDLPKEGLTMGRSLINLK
jgi:hypothetical protein